MPTSSTRALKDQPSGSFQRAAPGEQVEGRDEQERLAEMALRGLVVLPKRTPRTGFQGPTLPNRGKLASEMVIEDRR
jgi:hypothetical protein